MTFNSWQTNKAHFSVSDNKLTKTYFRAGNAYNDGILLDLIAESFIPQSTNGWTYRPLQVFVYTDKKNEIVVEFIEAETLWEYFDREQSPELFYHQGAWLGCLHASYQTNDNKVITFNDYNRNNILISHSTREVIATDPGNYDARFSPPDISLMTGAASVIRGVAGRGLATAFRALKAYIKGYVDHNATGKVPSLSAGKKALRLRITDNKFRSFASNKILKHILARVEVNLISFGIRISNLMNRSSKPQLKQ